MMDVKALMSVPLLKMIEFIMKLKLSMILMKVISMEVNFTLMKKRYRMSLMISKTMMITNHRRKTTEKRTKMKMDLKLEIRGKLQIQLMIQEESKDKSLLSLRIIIGDIIMEKHQAQHGIL